MKLNNRQALLLFMIARESMNVVNSIAGINQQVRSELINEIINQQGEELIDFEEEKRCFSEED